MKKEELIGNLTQIRGHINIGEKDQYAKGRDSAYDIAIELTKQLDEPEKVVVSKMEKVVIPQFVADWIKYQKRCKNGLFWALAKGSSKEKINAWLLPVSYQEKVKNEALLLDAWNYGYTIEPENKMLVTIKSYDQTESEFEIPESEAQKLIEELRGKHNEQ